MMDPSMTMEVLRDTAGGILLVASAIMLLLIVLMPLFVYMAQKWAHATFREAKALNQKTEEMMLTLEKISAKLGPDKKDGLDF